MPEEVVYCNNGDVSQFKTQKLSKPAPEELFTKHLTGDTKKNALDFVVWLRENKLSPRWQSANSWSVKYKNKNVCYIKLNDLEGSWFVYYSQFTRENWFKDYDQYIKENEFKNFILESIKTTLCSSLPCKGKRYNMTILGKQFDIVCGCWPIKLKNPDGTALEYSKKLILLIKNFIADLT